MLSQNKPTVQQLHKLKKLKQRQDALVSRNLRMISMMTSLGIPTLAGHILLGPGKLLQSPFSWLHHYETNEMTDTLLNNMHETMFDKVGYTLKFFDILESLPAHILEADHPLFQKHPIVDLLDWFDVTALMIEESLYQLNSNELISLKYKFVEAFASLSSLSTSRVKYSQNELLKKSLSEISQLMKKIWAEEKINPHLNKHVITQVLPDFEQKMSEDAFYLTHYKFMMGFVIFAFAFRFFINSAVNYIYNHTLKSNPAKPLTSHQADNLIVSMERKNNHLLTFYKVSMVSMALFMFAAMAFAARQLLNKDEEYPSVYVYILNALCMLPFDFKHYKNFIQEEVSEIRLQQHYKAVHSYFNSAVASTQTQWILDQHKMPPILIFSADVNQHKNPNKVNEIVKRVLKNHHIHVFSANDSLIIDVRLPTIKANIINAEINAKLALLKKGIEEKTPVIYPKVTRSQQQKMKGKPYHAPEVKITCTKSIIKQLIINEELKKQGQLIECENGARFFIQNPDENSEIKQEDIDSMLSDRGLEVARKFGQSGIKILTDHRMEIKNKNTRFRILLDKCDPISVPVKVGDTVTSQTIDVYKPSEFFVKR